MIKNLNRWLQIFSCVGFYIIFIASILEYVLNKTTYVLVFLVITIPIGWVGELWEMRQK